MARYIDIANDLRERVRSGEFAVGSTLPAIPALQSQYDVSGLNTIRAAQRVLIEEGLLRTEQGVGTFVIAAPSSRDNPADLLQDLRAAQHAIGRAIKALER